MKLLKPLNINSTTRGIVAALTQRGNSMEKQTVKFSIELTRSALRAALIFAAKNDIRYYLNCVCLHVGECGDARLVATDGHRLAIVKLCDQSSAAPGEYLIPGDMLKTIKKAGRLDKLPLLLTVDGERFSLADQYDGAILCGSKLIDGKFPDYQRIIPIPENMDGTPGTFNASYLADIQKALIELGDSNGFYSMRQNGEKSGALVMREDKGFLCVVMGMRGFDQPGTPDLAQFMPRRMPRAVVVMADPGLCGDFPRDPLQDVSDKRTPAADADYMEYLASMAEPALLARDLAPIGQFKTEQATPAGEAVQASGEENHDQASGEEKTEDETSGTSGEEKTDDDEDADADTTPAELCDDIERATYSPEDNKIRLYPARRLDPEIYARVKAAGFSWAPKQGVFVAPMWTPSRADLAESLAGEIEDEDTTLSERAADRADRFEDYQGKRAADADSARRAVDAIAQHIPFGQPILIGHHSERHARRDAQRIEDGMRRAVKMWDTAEYWTRRAAGAIAHAKYKERPDVRARRIKTLEAGQRKQQKTLDQAEKMRANWHKYGTTMVRALDLANYDHVSRCYPLADFPRDPPASQYEGSMGLWSALNGGIITAEQARDIAIISHARTITHARRWIDHYKNRIAYERAMLGAAGGLESDRVKPEKGGAIRCLWAPRGGWAWIVKVNTVTVSILHNYGNGGRNFQHNEPLDKIREVMSAADVEAARAAGRLIETDDKTGFYLAAPKPEDSAPAETVQASGEEKTDTTSGEENASAPEHDADADLIAALDMPTAEARALSSGEFAAIYERLEDANAHQYCLLLDAKRTGSAADVTEARAIMDAHHEAGHMTPELSARRAALADKLRAAENIAAIPEPTPAPAADPGAAFAAMRASLRAGVQVVTAPQLFPTPAGLAARMVELADIQPGARVLEPSAGTGRILQAIREAWTVGTMGRPTRTAVEIDPRLCDRLEVTEAGAMIVRGDFLAMDSATLGTFDRVLMNPPFINGADIAHIKHAAGMLKPGGRLVALCANGPRQRAQLMPLADTWEDLPAGTFGESGTDVRAALLVIEAPAATGTDDDASEADHVQASGEAIEPTPSGEAWKAAGFDPTTAAGYAQIAGNAAALLWWQDTLDSFFGSRLVDVRNALRGLGWEGGIYPAPAWPLTKGSGGEACRLVVEIQHVGAGRNMAGVTWRALAADGAELARVADLLTLDADALADALDIHARRLAAVRSDATPSGEAKPAQASGEDPQPPGVHYKAPAYPADSTARELVKAVEKVDLLKRVFPPAAGGR